MNKGDRYKKNQRKNKSQR